MIAADPAICRDRLAAFFAAEDAEDAARHARDEARRDWIRTDMWKQHVPHLVSGLPDPECSACRLEIDVKVAIAARVRAQVNVDALRAAPRVRLAR